MAETYTPKLTEAEKAESAERFAKAIFEQGGRIVINIKAGSGMGYAIKPEIYYLSEYTERVESLNLTYWMGACLGKKAVREWFGDSLRFSGIGYDRAHEATYTIGHLLEKYAPETFRANLDRALDLATSRYYEGN